MVGLGGQPAPDPVERLARIPQEAPDRHHDHSGRRHPQGQRRVSPIPELGQLPKWAGGITAKGARSMNAEETPPATQAWRAEPHLGGLYRLYLDGAPGYATALVDRGLPRAQQLEALAALDWVPAHPLSTVYDKTMAGNLPVAWVKGS